MTLFVRHYVVFALCLAASIWLGQASVSAQGLDIAEGRAHFEARHFEEAYKIIEPLAKRGNAEAQYLLGNSHETGLAGELRPQLAL
jgi:TPR repeat protein